MNFLVTAGNTQVLIDKVRCITNIFTGRTGASIAVAAYERGHAVTFLTSHPQAIDDVEPYATPSGERWQIVSYRTFEELQTLMRTKIVGQPLDAVIHCAAVSDYLAAGIFAPAPGTLFHAENGEWRASGATTLLDRQAGKVKSDEAELWLRMVRAPKLVDSIRTDWNFRGVLVKFKLEVGLNDEELLQVAERSRTQSSADLMVANTLEGAGAYAFLGSRTAGYERVERRDLAVRLLDAVEQLHEERRHG